MFKFSNIFQNCINLFNKSLQMDTDDLEPIDILSYITEELQLRIKTSKDLTNQAAIIENFLQQWEQLDKLEKMQIEFETDLDWFNIIEPITMQSLHGKLVILDFFTYCCINCMHVLPDLNALEELYPVERGLVVIGVHSPKFENEKNTANILSAAQRYGIKHPIVNDNRMLLWRSIGIHCWPSLLVISPNGKPILLLMGEGHGAFLKQFTDIALNYFEKKGSLGTFSIPSAPSNPQQLASNLRFPAKIARSDDNRFAIADAGNHRILIVDNKGIVLHKIGGCELGFLDGDFKQARFNSPQGVAFLNADVLLVADTENHALRQITLSVNRVETLAGTGQQGNDRMGGKLGALQSLSSPWDIAVYRTRDMDMSFHPDEQHIPEKTIILISMAGTHQIWGYFPEGIIWWKFRKFDVRTCGSIIGNGMEENRNNSYPQNAAFAQPSGLAIANDFLFIADSESSSIRKASMLDGKVSAVVGGDRNPLNLFAFGDIDGKQYNAKLQHPLGVAYNQFHDKIYIADTYNHKIKVIDTATNTIETLIIKNADGTAYSFNEPAGLCFDNSGDFLLISDTNNHQIKIVDMQTLLINNFNIDFNATNTEQLSETDSPLGRSSVQLIKRLPLRSFKELNLKVGFALHDGLKFTDEAPQKWTFSAANSTLKAATYTGRIESGNLNIQFKRSEFGIVEHTPEHIKLEIALCLCDTKSCLMKRFSLILSDNTEDEKANRTAIGTENLNVQVTQDELKLY